MTCPTCKDKTKDEGCGIKNRTDRCRCCGMKIISESERNKINNSENEKK